ncbi:ER-derived vesicles protein erv46 [Umbelopsis sp. WA50703]
MPKGGSALSRFRSLDAYAKTLDDFRVKTTSGAAVTIISGLLIAILVLSELSAYRTSIMKPELIVDKTRKDKLPIAFDVTFPKIPCYLLSLDIMDDSGQHLSGYTHDIYKVRLDQQGNHLDTEKAKELGDHSGGADLALQPDQPDQCGSCYGAPSPNENGCCNTCEDVREAYIKTGWGFSDPSQFEQCVKEGWRDRFETQSNEGCNIHGTLLVNKVRGNFHIAPGLSFQQSHMHVHDMAAYLAGGKDGHKFDFTHHINKLQFGDEISEKDKRRTAKGTPVELKNPLDNTSQNTEDFGMMYQYFLKIVSTEFRYLSGRRMYTNQYSVTEHERKIGTGHGHEGLPGVFFNLDISPMMVIYQETRPSFTSFITGVCAIVGGIFTVAGIIDSVLYRAERQFRKKMEMGKVL